MSSTVIGIRNTNTNNILLLSSSKLRERKQAGVERERESQKEEAGINTQCLKSSDGNRIGIYTE